MLADMVDSYISQNVVFIQFLVSAKKHFSGDGPRTDVFAKTTALLAQKFAG